MLETHPSPSQEGSFVKEGRIPLFGGVRGGLYFNTATKSQLKLNKRMAAGTYSGKINHVSAFLHIVILKISCELPTFHAQHHFRMTTCERCYFIIVTLLCMIVCKYISSCCFWLWITMG